MIALTLVESASQSLSGAVISARLKLLAVKLVLFQIPVIIPVLHIMAPCT